MFGLQPTHLIIIVVVGLFFFVPARLPKLGRAFGQMIIELRDSFKGIAQDTGVEPDHQTHPEK